MSVAVVFHRAAKGHHVTVKKINEHDIDGKHTRAYGWQVRAAFEVTKGVAQKCHRLKAEHNRHRGEAVAGLGVGDRQRSAT